MLKYTIKYDIYKTINLGKFLKAKKDLFLKPKIKFKKYLKKIQNKIKIKEKRILSII